MPTRPMVFPRRDSRTFRRSSLCTRRPYKAVLLRGMAAQALTALLATDCAPQETTGPDAAMPAGTGGSLSGTGRGGGSGGNTSSGGTTGSGGTLGAAGTTNSALWDKGTNTPSKRLWVEGNFARFVRPGFVRVGTIGAAPAGVMVSAYKNPADGRVAIVAINNGTSGTSIPVFISGASPCSLTPWVTSSTDSLASKTPVSAVGSRFSLSLGAQSVTTFVGDP